MIGSDREVTVGGKRLLGRQTKWGFIEVENKKHCEFAQLRDMLIRSVGGAWVGLETWVESSMI